MAHSPTTDIDVIRPPDRMAPPGENRVVQLIDRAPKAPAGGLSRAASSAKDTSEREGQSLARRLGSTTLDEAQVSTLCVLVDQRLKGTADLWRGIEKLGSSSDKARTVVAEVRPDILGVVDRDDGYDRVAAHVTGIGKVSASAAETARQTFVALTQGAATAILGTVDTAVQTLTILGGGLVKIGTEAGKGAVEIATAAGKGVVGIAVSGAEGVVDVVDYATRDREKKP